MAGIRLSSNLELQGQYIKDLRIGQPENNRGESITPMRNTGIRVSCEKQIKLNSLTQIKRNIHKKLCSLCSAF